MSPDLALTPFPADFRNGYAYNAENQIGGYGYAYGGWYGGYGYWGGYWGGFAGGGYVSDASWWGGYGYAGYAYGAYGYGGYDYLLAGTPYEANFVAASLYAPTTLDFDGVQIGAVSTIGADSGAQAPAQHVLPSYAAFWPYTPPTPSATLPSVPTPQPNVNDNSLETLVAYTAPMADDEGAAGGVAQDVQTTEETVAEGESTAAAQAAKDEVQTQLAQVNYQNVPVERIDAMVTDKLATRYSLGDAEQNHDYVYFATAAGDHIVQYVLKYELQPTAYMLSAGHPVPTQSKSVYKVVYEQTLDLGDGAGDFATVLARFQSQEVADRTIGGYLSKVANKDTQILTGVLMFAVHLTPVLGTADTIFNEKDYIEGTISAVGDAATILTLGGSKLFTAPMQLRKVRIGLLTAETVAGGYRAYQGAEAAQRGDKIEAGMYFGEAFLRFVGVSKGAIDELKAIQAAKALRAGAAKALARPNLFLEAQGKDLSKLTKAEVGDLGEGVAHRILEDSGYTDIIAIKNARNQGIDLAARGRDGRIAFFEVKTSSTGELKKITLSARQKNMRKFVEEILRDAAGKNGSYKNIDSQTQQWAEQALKQFLDDPLSISGETIVVDLLNEDVLISPWR